MSRHTRSSKKYALSLFESTDHSVLDRRVEQLARIAAAIESNHDLKVVLVSPLVPMPKREEVLREVARLYGEHDGLLEDFLVIALRNGRISNLSEIAADFKSLIEELRKTLSLEIESAWDIGHDQRMAFEHQVRERLGSLASFSWKVEPKLIAGYVVKAGDKTLDTSVSGSLERLRNQLV